MWKPIFNVAVESIDKPDWDRELVFHMLTNRLLTAYMEKADSRTRLLESRATLDVWVWTIGVMTALESAAGEKLYLAVTGRRYLLIDCDCPDETR